MGLQAGPNLGLVFLKNRIRAGQMSFFLYNIYIIYMNSKDGMNIAY